MQRVPRGFFNATLPAIGCVPMNRSQNAPEVFTGPVVSIVIVPSRANLGGGMDFVLDSDIEASASSVQAV